MKPPAQPASAITELAPQGRRYLQIAIGFLVVTDLITIAVYASTMGTERLPQQFARIVLWSVIAYFLLKGKSWARWLLLVLLMLGLLAVFPTLRRPGAFDAEHRVGTMLLLCLYVGYGVVARGLVYSDSVRAFFRAHKPA